MKSNSIDEKTLQTVLSDALKYGIISLGDVEIIMKKNEKSSLLQNHPYKVWEGNDGRWRTYITDSSKKAGRRLLVKSTEEKLLHELQKYYDNKLADGKTEAMTLEILYPEWLEYKRLHTQAETYIIRINADWKHYYLNTDIIHVPIVKMDKLLLDKWAHKLIKDNQMTKVQYYNSTVIIRQALDYAVDLGLIEKNPFLLVSIDGKRMFRKVKKKPDETQVFSKEELKAIVPIAWEDFHTSRSQHRLAPLSVLFQFQTGLRIGEICALKYSDIEKPDTIHVQRMLRRDTNEIVEHTKSEYGDREVILTSTAQKIIAQAKETQHEFGVDNTEYIFSMTPEPLPQHAIAYRYRKYCQKANTIQKSSHKARKTYISTLIDGHVNINTIREMVGHADERTTLGNYCFDRSSMNERKSLIEAALN